jgi:DNA primase
MDQIEEIKAKVDIVDFIKQYLDLKKAGINYSACCPFHSEKTPSFMVSAERQSFRCFGCGEGGDVISFFQKIECLSFPEALKILGEKVGVKVSFSKGNFEADKSEKETVYRINLLSAKFFKLLLNDKVGKVALDYLKDRGLSEATIEKLKIGFAPPDDRLLQAFSRKKIDFNQLAKAGHPERFRYRLMFPIFDNFGSVIGFSGRIIEEGLPKFISPHPKYLNTPETVVFHKSKAIYGINFAKDAIREKKRVILVEGQMDVALAHEAGIEEVVASSGTALTQDHLKILSRLSENIILCFDEDEAGQKAAISATELALEMGLDVKLTKIIGYKDVGELVKDNKQALSAVFDKALPPVEWLALKYENYPSLSAAQKKEFVKLALNFIGRFQSDIEKAHYISYLAKKVSVAEITIEKVLEKTKLAPKAKEESTKEIATTIEDRVVAFLLNYPEQIKGEKLGEIQFENSSLSTIYNELKTCYNNEQQVKEEVGKIKSKLSRELKERLDAVSVSWDEKIAEDLDVAKEDFLEIKTHLEKLQKEKVKSDFATRIAQAETSGDITKVKELMKSLQESLK